MRNFVDPDTKVDHVPSEPHLSTDVLERFDISCGVRSRGGSAVIETNAIELPFTDISGPNGVAVDSSGAVYVSEYGDNRVLKLAAGATSPTNLPFSGLKKPWGVAVDSSGNVYVADYGNKRVLKLAVE